MKKKSRNVVRRAIESIYCAMCGQQVDIELESTFSIEEQEQSLLCPYCDIAMWRSERDSSATEQTESHKTKNPSEPGSLHS
jgi:DNA-directed RNA polymerase subunit RPC12/RpoP